MFVKQPFKSTRACAVNRTPERRLVPCSILMKMADYDFSSLSAYDFETLVRDLLSAYLDVGLEIFSPGPDGGIDLRFLARTSADSTIVQCKHYVGSGFSKLLNALTKEQPKIARLNPDRYCVATSVALTPDRKAKIVATLAPFVDRASDIWGQAELNALLRRYPTIERAHFKLWLTSQRCWMQYFTARFTAGQRNCSRIFDGR